MVTTRNKTGLGVVCKRLLSPIFSSFSLKNTLKLLILTLLTFFAFIFNEPAHVYATASTLTISIADIIELDAEPFISGSFTHSDTTTPNISIKTTNGSGYTLGIKTSVNNSNALINTDDNTKTIPSITTSGGISESTYSSDSSYNNTWGFRPSKINSTANSNYLPAPTSNSTVTTLDATSTANPTTANTYNLAVGTRVNYDTAAGSYTNIFVITTTANPIPYTITYNQNTTDTVTNMPSNTSSSTYSETVNINSNTPARNSYNFKGWCTIQVADGGTCSGTTYNPDGGGTNLTWTLNQTASSNSLILYAMWESADSCIDHQTELYCKVAAMSKGKQTLTEFRSTVRSPDATNTISTNSGVYEYDASVFGVASDAANTHKIYYYRGVLDSYGHTGSRGSDGDNDAFPNTVVLSSASSKSGLTTSDTCWRIVRTTGSGGVKMIYQGKWKATGDSGSCKNTGSSTYAVNDVYFNRRSTTSTNGYDTKGRIIYVGYNYSTNTSLQTSTTDTPNSTLFANGQASNYRTKLESWYNSNMTAWTSKLEGSAGYCNDRTTYDSGYHQTYSNIPYKTSSADVLFGPYVRLLKKEATLTCPNDTGYDLLTTTNGYIGVPSAPLTYDEVAFTGSGWSSVSNASNYLHAYALWELLSPGDRLNEGTPYNLNMSTVPYAGGGSIYTTGGMRPAISFISGTTVASGSGTATDPWIINPGPTMQNITNNQLASLMPNNGDSTTLEDVRDGTEYKITKIANKYWMTQNLKITGTISAADSNFTGSNVNISAGDLTSGNSYVQARTHVGVDGDGNDTTWYNFCSATAGTICTSSSDVESQYDICPKGWRLPTQAEQTSAKDYPNLLELTLGGYWSGGSLTEQTTRSYYWASTAYNTTQRYTLRLIDTAHAIAYSNRRYGFYVRCVHD